MLVLVVEIDDVLASYEAKDKVDYLVNKGIIVDFPDCMLKPKTSVRREQFAKMFYIAKGLKEYKPSRSRFKDITSSR